MLHGGCLCGAVRYEIDGLIRHISHCHCSMCRKFHGAAFATYATFAAKRFRLASGADRITAYRSSDHGTRSFCQTCGSSLFWAYDTHPELVALALGTLDDDPGGRPTAHIYVGSKAPWFEITDALPQHEKNAPATA
jgi:hypothetical protein